MTFPCTGCGKFVFAAPILCYWCLTLDADRTALIEAGIHRPKIVDAASRADRFEAERIRLQKSRRSLRKKR